VVEHVRRLVVAGVLRRQADAFAAADPAVRRKGLLVGAVTVVAHAAIDLRSVLRSTDSPLLLDRSSASGPALASCASTEEVLAQNHGAVCRLGDAAQQGLQWLRARTASTDDDRGAVLSRRLQTLVDATRDRIDCS
jgi:asparagine N-glycosylation enzyme membrane subunit Stt3